MGMDEESGQTTTPTNAEARPDADMARLFSDTPRPIAQDNATSPDTDAPQVPQMARSRRTENHTLTLRDAFIAFQNAGIPRAPRTIQRYCKQGYLDAVCDSDEGIYYITPKSVEDRISYIKEINSRHSVASMYDTPPPIARPAAASFATTTDKRRDTVNDGAPMADERRDNTEHDTPEERLRILKRKYQRLQFDKKVSDEVANRLEIQIQKDREHYHKLLMKGAHRVGELENRLLQLGEPAEKWSEVEDAQTPKLPDSAPSRAFSNDLKE